ALELVEGQAVYSATVDGPFKVEVAVDELESTNIYINNNRAASVNYDAMPTHGIIRVIVQQGEMEPSIFVINLTDTNPPIQPAATLTLDCNGGNIDGNATYTMKFDANMAGDPLPEPVAPNNSVEFAGWYAGLQPVDSIPAVVGDATFVAHWAPKQVEPGEETVGVSFRLIGSTRASGDVDYANGDTKGAEYVTWIATKPYTMPAGSTVADLIVRACNDAGLTQSNALGGYVSKVTAPASYGGYTLSEFTNGPRSGWMYTIGEAGTQHPGRGVAEKVLSDGDVVILHYVNDYAWEVEDWSALGGSGWPSLYGDNTQYLNGWMQAEDDDPPPYVPPETPTTPEEPKPVFEDVPEDAWFAEAVDWAVENGITTGTTATTFEPELDCTRAQVVTFLWRAAGEPKASAANPFTDVVEGSFYYDAVLWAVENGITTGTTATTFEPDAPCTRGQVVTFLWRAAGKPASGAANPFADVAEGAWYYDAVLWAAESGVTTGTSATTFAPDLNCTRAQVVTFLWREAK
ncbi:MAG: S-layer homology domain-containing protein, partial [Oscillospiraceae bacterium]|nr:S-layer homology domain-containing protein [Oscillospiraceae bacterium]